MTTTDITQPSEREQVIRTWPNHFRIGCEDYLLSIIDSLRLKCSTIAAEEREACAKVAEERAGCAAAYGEGLICGEPEEIAAAIRVRGTP